MSKNKDNTFRVRKLTFITGLLFLAPFLFNCGRSYNPDITRGSTYLFQTGHPEVRIAAIGLFDQKGNPGINVTADIVYGSLIYKEEDKKYTANINITLQIVSQKKDSSLGTTRNYDLTVQKDNKEIIHSGEVFTFQKRIPIKPGKYNVTVAVTDKSSKKQTVRSTHAEIPNPKSTEVSLTNVLLLARNFDNQQKHGYLPVTTYDVPGKLDSLKFEFQVTKKDPNKHLDVDMKLVRFKSDTMPAREMFAPNPSPSTLPYRGIDYRDETVVQTQKRVLRSETGNILIQYQTVRPKRGNYRFEVNLKGAGIDEKKDFKARDFSVKSKNYPNVRTPRELAEPLYYLMKKKNYKKLMAIKNPDSLKQAIDAFWYNNVGSLQKAKKVLQLYYQRVEQANKQFSNYKEGWKTDPGMIYILFGPPWYVERSLDHMQWTYGYDRYDPLRNFEFIETKIPSKYYPYHNYILQRQNYYFNVNYQKIQDWLSGYVLTHDL